MPVAGTATEHYCRRIVTTIDCGSGSLHGPIGCKPVPVHRSVSDPTAPLTVPIAEHRPRSKDSCPVNELASANPLIAPRESCPPLIHVPSTQLAS
jgi:hypothetical protein